LGRLYLWEFTGDDSIVERPLNLRLDWQVRGIATDDTDGDAAMEILGVGSASTDGGSMKIFEHTGAPGENSYATVYDYDTPSYLFGLAPGDADNDGRGEVVLAVGGVSGFPTYIRRIEYNPALATWEHKLFEAATTGLPISALVADLDGDDANELVLGSNQAIYIYESFANDTFTPVWTSDFAILGNVMDLTLGPPNDLGYPVVTACCFEGQVHMVGFDGVSYRRELEPPLAVGNPLRSVDHYYFDGDIRDDLVLARSGVNLVSVYEGADLTAAQWPAADRAGAILQASPNPFRERVEIRFAATKGWEGKLALEILDVRGRRVAGVQGRPVSDGIQRFAWDGRTDDGRRLPSGIYLIHLRGADRELCERVVLLR
jgi:hypothetical protein